MRYFIYGDKFGARLANASFEEFRVVFRKIATCAFSCCIIEVDRFLVCLRDETDGVAGNNGRFLSRRTGRAERAIYFANPLID